MLASASASEEETSNDTDSDTWLQHLALIVGGELPCSKEEAAILAAISMRLDDAWPHTQARMSAQAAPAAGPGPGGEAAGGGGGGGGGGWQVCLSVTAANEQHGESAGHVLALDESDGEREHERMLSEFLNKHRKADRSLVRSSCSSSSLSPSPASDRHGSHALQADLLVLLSAGARRHVLPNGDQTGLAAAARSAQRDLVVQVRTGAGARAGEAATFATG